ncbi:MAG TPA: serine/threonine-protein kinase [Candidatus Polarisedimenticolaceae bacterium]|nr:serine/threonine-protein kinase [Candidatus Polarisedimenticolaceae bacterium]
MHRCPRCTRPVSDGDRFCPACGAPLVTPTSAPTEISAQTPISAPRAFTPGTMLAGRYRIVAFVGRGGMGEVYRADDLRLGEAVALKFLPEDVAADPGRRKRFDDEVRLARTIAHPNVCRVYDVGESDGRTFLTMEYVDGEDLVSLLRRIGRLPPAKGVEIARQLCAGLAAAHERGVLHRDLKPANVMIDGRGHAKITDFGLAVAETEEAGDGAGTPAYMSPEQLAGKPATARSDLYALGLVLYEVFTGKRALEAATLAEWRSAHASSIPSKPSLHVPELDPAAEQAMLRCLEKDPARRPASATHLAAMLPGGDPLAAALAAGETPSPELVAAAGEEGTLSLPRATAWLVVALASIAISVVAISRYAPLNLIAAPKSPEVLEDGIGQILKTLGFESRPVMTWWGTHWDADAAAKAGSVAEMGTLRPSPMIFAYRQSPQYLDPPRREDGVNFEEPPPYFSGETRVVTDMAGNLRDVIVMPDETISPETPALGSVDWAVPFRLAGLDLAAFREAEPQWAPFVPADERRAWKGTIGSTEVRIEGAAWRGRVDRFSVILPTDRSSRMGAEFASVSQRFAAGLIVGVILATFLMLSFLARRNLRLDRASRAGAMKSAAITGAFCFLCLLPHQSWRADAEFIWWTWIECIGIALMGAACVWLAYVAIEPYLRRNAPHRLIAWTRLLDGRWRDPLVGREVLCGTAIGATSIACWALPWIIGVPLGWKGLNAMLATPVFYAGRFWSDLLFDVFASIGYTWMFTGAFLLLKLALRRELLAWIGLGLVFAGGWAGIALPPGVKIAFLIANATLAVIAFRIGQVTATVMTVVIALLVEAPFGIGRWYAWRGYVVLAIVLAIAIYGFRVAIGKRTLLPS